MIDLHANEQPVSFNDLSPQTQVMYPSLQASQSSTIPRDVSTLHNNAFYTTFKLQQGIDVKSGNDDGHSS
ncbi:hypothetical protein O0I10_013049 [Lichtheimia ornata]|uniref:Uncharacterized protein n=1 Tax=Lichtheimia ornata TaxID=688661 RepID=A0AAD7XR75_9FUNG|nr:uncharacterized protein O0I10_013049 [Lichtheimia ornata]KAJ8651410.1 hypothetical protein O0I10_013049 [Lichtheimia ornata]